jgi:hypothetical protein
LRSSGRHRDRSQRCCAALTKRTAMVIATLHEWLMQRHQPKALPACERGRHVRNSVVDFFLVAH